MVDTNTNEIIARRDNSFQSVSKAEFVGSVVHKHRPKNDVIVLTVAVSRGGDTPVDYPNITFYGADVVEAIDNAITINSGAKKFPRVCINAEIQTSKKIVDGEAKYFQNIIGRELHKAPTKMERITGKRSVGSHKLDAVNEVCIIGQVVRTFPFMRAGQDRPIGTVVTFRTIQNGRINFPKVTCYGATSAAAANLQPNDVVCAIGSIRTRFNEETRERRETIVCSEIALIQE